MDILINLYKHFCEMPPRSKTPKAFQHESAKQSQHMMMVVNISPANR